MSEFATLIIRLLTKPFELRLSLNLKAQRGMAAPSGLQAQASPGASEVQRKGVGGRAVWVVWAVWAGPQSSCALAIRPPSPRTCPA